MANVDFLYGGHPEGRFRDFRVFPDGAKLRFDLDELHALYGRDFYQSSAGSETLEVTDVVGNAVRVEYVLYNERGDMRLLIEGETAKEKSKPILIIDRITDQTGRVFS